MFKAMCRIVQGFALLQHKPILQRGQQCRLIAFDRQQVIRLFRDNRLGNFGLATHRIDGHQIALDQESVQQFRDCRDFVTLLGDLFLTENKTQIGSKGADQVNRSRIAVARAPHRLAIHRQGAAYRRNQARYPTPKGLLECLRIQDAKHPIKGIVRRNAILQLQEALQPSRFSASPRRRHPRTC